MGSRFCEKKLRSFRGYTSRSRTPVKLQYEPRIIVLQHGYDVCAPKYGRLARVVPSEILFFVQNLKPRLEQKFGRRTVTAVIQCGGNRAHENLRHHGTHAHHAPVSVHHTY